MNLGFTRALGWIVIAHGLSHAVLPLRGSLAPAYDVNDWMPLGLNTVSMVGFVAAGLGLLGLRPFTIAISPLMVLASGLSLVAIQRLGHADLFIGGMFDAVFFFLGLWRAYAGWPVAGREHGRVWHVLGLALGFAFLGYVAAATMIWPWHRTWGSTRAEVAMMLPGDRQMRNPALEIQHAVTIDAPPEDVWPWLVQAAEHWTITERQPERALVVAGRGAFVLVPTGDGRTRFIIRSATTNAAMPVWTAALEFMTGEIPNFIRERRMMLAVKARAEQHGRLLTSSR